MNEALQTVECEATGQTVAKRFTRRTEDGHIVSVQAYNKVMLELKTSILTLEDIRTTLKALDSYSTNVRKYVLWALNEPTIVGSTPIIKVKNLINAQNVQSVLNYKKQLDTVTRSEHLLLMSDVDYSHAQWTPDASSNSAILDAIYYYLNYFSCNKHL